MAARLAGKVAIITGATGGIGRVAGELFAAEGARVLLVDLEETALQQTAAAIGHGASYAVADVTDPAQTEAYVATALQRYGKVDLFLNNAGIEGDVAPITDYDIDTFDRVMAVNVRGVWLGLKYVMAAMRERGGSIVITSSIAGLVGTTGMSAYHGSKHAVIGLMRCAAIEGGPHGIRVNTVNPGPTETRMMRSIEDMNVPGRGEKFKHRLTRGTLDGRYGEPEEVARMMLFLCSDESAHCTGGVFVVDGGLTL